MAIALSFFISARSVEALTLTPIRLAVAGDPGQTISTDITVINEKDTAETFYSSYANFEAQGETGTPTFNEAKEGLDTWITAPDSVFLAPGVSKKVTINIAIPKDATPGGYFAAVFWGTVPPDAKSGDQVAIGTKIGSLVLLRVSGDVKEEAQVLGFSTTNNQKFFTALPVGMFYRFQNGGGDRALPKGDVIIRNVLGIKAATVNANTVAGNVLPGQIRRFTVAWMKKNQNVDEPLPKMSFFQSVAYEWHNFAFGRFSANLALVYGEKDTSVSAKTAFWVIPWQLLIIILIILLILFKGGKMLLRKYNNWIIGQAKLAASRGHDMGEPNHEHGNTLS